VSDGIVAPGYTPEALAILMTKKSGAVIILQAKPGYVPPAVEYREVYGMMMGQKRNDAAISASSLARVVTAQTDPDPRVQGKGHALLRAAGVALTEGVLEPQARALQAGFLKRVTQGLPFVTLKLASTLDGRIATATGESRWISGPAARRKVHQMRLDHDAVLTTSATALADDPDLTARDIGATHQPLRLLLDTNLRTPAHSRLGQTAQTHPVWVLHAATAPDAARHAWHATGARLIEISTSGAHLDPVQAFRRLAAEGLTRILIEAGGTFAAALIRARLVDDLALFQAGCLIGAETLRRHGSTCLIHAPDLLAQRIAAGRSEQPVAVVVTRSARIPAELPFWQPTRPSARAIGAPELVAHLCGEMDLPQAVAAAKLSSRQYAKRQRTWFRSRMAGWQAIVLP
jgi:diaminohydroxyphosphoribosylaminopyrimidine deaminase/5-amino-6-(5-phosphoribosylamino)uracil reductase